ncbi:antibiotic biosynthesis monooxygenase [Streptomyces sp. NPDC051976]|uniref:putative quinol monooxygenase n=1 Tax=Streptomyces sp. NPDC051976 TaxID=3154947 RepID=UPI003445BEF4
MPRRRAAARPSDQEDLPCSPRCFPSSSSPACRRRPRRSSRSSRPRARGKEPGTLSFRVYRHPANPDYLLFVEHFADQAAYDAHTGSAVYAEMIAGRFAGMVTDFVELDHELLVAL